ncbi:MAG TPA: hypothetical protein VFL79_19935 [Terriglobia bacterium]|nr:hypothetical protein [Terriglobia bacterium]
MLIGLFVEGFAQHDRILVTAGTYCHSFTLVKPEAHAIEEAKLGPIKDKVLCIRVIRIAQKINDTPQWTSHVRKEIGCLMQELFGGLTD